MAVALPLFVHGLVEGITGAKLLHSTVSRGGASFLFPDCPAFHPNGSVVSPLPWSSRSPASSNTVVQELLQNQQHSLLLCAEFIAIVLTTLGGIPYILAWFLPQSSAPASPSNLSALQLPMALGGATYHILVTFLAAVNYYGFATTSEPSGGTATYYIIATSKADEPWKVHVAGVGGLIVHIGLGLWLLLAARRSNARGYPSFPKKS
ncbi:hypothetical protein DFJ73DRAFT_852877, partial [Zopfochytrium polystomum]